MSNLNSELARRADEAESKLADLHGKLEQISQIMHQKEEKTTEHGHGHSHPSVEGFELYYWKLKNRGNYVRMLLAEAGVKYQEVTDPAVWETKCRCRNKMEENGLCNEPFAPPFIYHNGRVISQTPAVILYTGEITGLTPKSRLDVAAGIMIVGNISDAMNER